MHIEQLNLRNCSNFHIFFLRKIFFSFKVYLENGTLFANVTSPRPGFNVSRLDPGTSYQIKVYVAHGPVTSVPVVVSAYTSRTSSKDRGKYFV